MDNDRAKLEVNSILENLKMQIGKYDNPRAPIVILQHDAKVILNLMYLLNDLSTLTLKTRLALGPNDQAAIGAYDTLCELNLVAQGVAR